MCPSLGGRERPAKDQMNVMLRPRLDLTFRVNVGIELIDLVRLELLQGPVAKRGFDVRPQELAVSLQGLLTDLLLPPSRRTGKGGNRFAEPVLDQRAKQYQCIDGCVLCAEARTKAQAIAATLPDAAAADRAGRKGTSGFSNRVPG
jgi:hypothetical protein